MSNYINVLWDFMKRNNIESFQIHGFNEDSVEIFNDAEEINPGVEDVVERELNSICYDVFHNELQQAFPEVGIFEITLNENGIVVELVQGHIRFTEEVYIFYERNPKLLYSTDSSPTWLDEGKLEEPKHRLSFKSIEDLSRLAQDIRAEVEWRSAMGFMKAHFNDDAVTLMVQSDLAYEDGDTHYTVGNVYATDASGSIAFLKEPETKDDMNEMFSDWLIKAQDELDIDMNLYGETVLVFDKNKRPVSSLTGSHIEAVQLIDW